MMLSVSHQDVKKPRRVFTTSARSFGGQRVESWR
jgi:hypothetical protein